MKIVVDENMPYARELFSRVGDVVAVPGRPLPVEALAQVQALMVRSVTPVNAALLAGTEVTFVGSATAGTDHVDETWLREQGVGFSAAPGCNAIAVVEYVFSALLMLAERDGFQLRDKTVGIVGVGNVGRRLQARLNAWGVKTLLCDPPRARNGDVGPFLPLDTLLREADILTLHTPLTKGGPDNTFHLIDDGVAAWPAGRILINACRGPVVDNAALLRALQQGKDLRVVLDVWEPEPGLSLDLLARADVGTAHIAGYTLEGKARGTTQVFEALCQFMGQPQQVPLASPLPVPDITDVHLTAPLDQALLKRLVHLVYDVRRDDALLRQSAGQSGGFDRLRKHYQERREWSSLRVTCSDEASVACLNALGFTAILP
ncbi:MAG: DUF3410 domain-containing protein [Symbiopectobacterium sp.]|uniref:DUF3410 domain-containing protein n=1 Tax=Symbiopectobacterium sp. TaxID=2952789 RepID=UPI0039ECFA85